MRCSQHSVLGPFRELMHGLAMPEEQHIAVWRGRDPLRIDQAPEPRRKVGQEQARPIQTVALPYAQHSIRQALEAELP